MTQNSGARSLSRSRGQSVAECLVAIAILMPVIVLVTKNGFQSDRDMDQVRYAHGANGEIINARERIGLWNYDEITTESIATIPFLVEGTRQGMLRTWKCDVVEVSEPIPAKQVTLSIQWTDEKAGITHDTGSLSFWVPKP